MAFEIIKTKVFHDKHGHWDMKQEVVEVVDNIDEAMFKTNSLNQQTDKFFIKEIE